MSATGGWAVGGGCDCVCGRTEGVVCQSRSSEVHRATDPPPPSVHHATTWCSSAAHTLPLLPAPTSLSGHPHSPLPPPSPPSSSHCTYPLVSSIHPPSAEATIFNFINTMTPMDICAMLGTCLDTRLAAAAPLAPLHPQVVAALVPLVAALQQQPSAGVPNDKCDTCKVRGVAGWVGGCTVVPAAATVCRCGPEWAEWTYPAWGDAIRIAFS